MNIRELQFDSGGTINNSGSSHRNLPIKCHTINKVLIECAMAIAAALTTAACEKTERPSTEGRKMEEHAKMSKEEALQMLWGDNERIHHLDTNEAFPPYTGRLTALQIFSAAKIVQGGDPDAPAIREISREWGYQYIYFDKNGRNVFGAHHFFDATPFHEGIAVVKDNLNNSDKPSYYYINRDGANIFDINGFVKASPFADGFALVSRSGTKYYFINKNGVNIFKHEFTDAKSFQEGFALVYEGEKCHFINKNGANAFGDKQFVSADSFNEGLATVYDGKKWHYINTNGENAFGDKAFSKAGSFKGDYAEVTYGIRPYVINKNGEEVK